MLKKIIQNVCLNAFRFIKDTPSSTRYWLGQLFAFSHVFFLYNKKKVITWSYFFEKNKNTLVKFFLMKRGRYNRPFLHITAMAVMGIGIMIAPFLADTYPILSSQNSLSLQLKQVEAQSITAGEDVFQTQTSEKPRDTVITYTVQKGDTISTIAKKFGIDSDTVKWVNDLTTDNLTVGDELKILPVSGILHKVAKGDSVYTIAKKYDTEAQKIVDFPFNDFANPETFSLVEGQILIVPDGIKPSEKPTFKRQVFIATGPVSISGAGFTWPIRGSISQFASWYHMALDITSDMGAPIIAAQNGTVAAASVGTWDGGYGTNVIVDNGNGFASLYAHMSAVNVSAGDDVVAGKTLLGWVGMTGRTTGPHLHFEIRKGGALVNPLPYLQ